MSPGFQELPFQDESISSSRTEAKELTRHQAGHSQVAELQTIERLAGFFRDEQAQVVIEPFLAFVKVKVPPEETIKHVNHILQRGVGRLEGLRKIDHQGTIHYIIDGKQILIGKASE